MPGLSSLQVNIKDQPHNLAWINEREQALLKDLGGSGRPGPMGIPAYDEDNGFNTDLDEDYESVQAGPGEPGYDGPESNQSDDQTKSMFSNVMGLGETIMKNSIAGRAGTFIGDFLDKIGLTGVPDNTPFNLDAEDVGDDTIIPPVVEEEDGTEEEEQLGTMEQFFVDRDAAQGLNQNEILNNMIDRLGIQNRTIEPFNEWLAGQSEAMRAADMTTQTNEYRKSLRDQTSPAQSYLPRVQPAADRTTDQSFINNLYGPSAKKTSATQALFDELGI